MNRELFELYSAEAEKCLQTMERVLEKGISAAVETFANAAMGLRASAKLVGLSKVSDLADAVAVSASSFCGDAADQSELANGVAALRRIALGEQDSSTAYAEAIGSRNP